MTSPPNRPRGSARVPGPEPDGPGSRGPDSRGYSSPDTGRYRSGQHSSGGAYDGSPSGGRHSAGGSGYEEPSGRHGRSASSGTYGGGGSHGAPHRSDDYDNPPPREYTRRLRSPAPPPDEPTTGRHSRGTGSSGRASVGSASVGSASVGSASVGSASVGKASVGSASVGSASVGSASVGRASVGADAPEDLLAPPRSRTEARLAAKNSVKNRKKRRRRQIIVAGIAALLLLTGIGTIGAGYYFTSVTVPTDLPPKVPSSIYYSDGKTLMAKLGASDGAGSHVDVNKLPKYVKYAVVAAEDRTFYSNSGVDFKGIVRAAWGHLLGNEDAGGASTITMQYVKLMEDRLQTNRTYTEKLKESVIALKLSQKYSKDQILGYYLDLVYFNRGAYGLEAAAQTYFGKDASKLTPEQAAVLAGVIKDPYNFDPANNKKAAQDRWKYVLEGMQKLGAYDKPISLANYPKVKKYDPNTGGTSVGLDKPTGLVVGQVEQELVNNGVFDTVKDADQHLRTDGYKIVTTINAKAEKDAVNAATKYLKPYQSNNDGKLQDALVAVEPGTGRVIAYYGGSDGTGYDNASNPHQPGSSFKIYTLEAALNNGYSVKSYWNGDASQKFAGRGGDGMVHNSDGEVCADGGVGTDGHRRCSLTEATVMSLNTVFYDLTQKLGREKVIDVAQKSGIHTLWTTQNGKEVPLDLDKANGAEAAAQATGVGDEVGFGQNPVTPLDHAGGTATLANEGTATTTHFIEKMYDSNGKAYYTPKIEHTYVFSHAVASDMDYMLQKVPTQSVQFIEPRRPQANKTGTWQYGDSDSKNSQAWTIGYIPQLAGAVWVGAKDGSAIYNKWGAAMYGWDAAGTIWAQFMSAVVKDLNIPAKSFPPASFVGNPKLGTESNTAPSPSPSPSPSLTSPSPSPSSDWPGGGWGNSPTPSSSVSPTCNVPGWCKNSTTTGGTG